MAYTIVLTTGAGSYTFDVTPELSPQHSPEFDTNQTPAVMIADVETWVMNNAVFRSATQATVTTDFASLVTLLTSRTSPITSCAFKRDGTAVYEMTPTTHKGGVFMRALDAAGSGGLFANHWRGTLVIFGRRLLADASNIVLLQRSVSYRGNASGLLTIASRGTVQTLPGTSAEDAARTAAADDEPTGSAFGLVDGDEDGDPSVEILDATDTRASWSATWVEHGVSLPGGVNEWKHDVTTTEDPKDGKRVTIVVSARGPAMGPLRTAVRSKKPSTGLERMEERESEVDLACSATYVARLTPEEQEVPQDGDEGLFWRRLEVDVSGAAPGEDRDSTVFLVPGFSAWIVPRPRQPITITERVTSKFRGNPSGVAALGLASQAKTLSGVVFQPGASRPPTMRLEEGALTISARVWVGEATYVYLADEVDGDQLAGFVKGMAR